LQNVDSAGQVLLPVTCVDLGSIQFCKQESSPATYNILTTDLSD